MSCTRLTWLVDKFLENLFDTDVIRASDAQSGLRSVAIRPDAIIKSWNFLKDNWDEVYSRFALK